MSLPLSPRGHRKREGSREASARGWGPGKLGCGSPRFKFMTLTKRGGQWERDFCRVSGSAVPITDEYAFPGEVWHFCFFSLATNQILLNFLKGIKVSAKFEKNGIIQPCS